MKYTLLDMTQTILSSMDSDEINSINDNQESLQVATIIRTVFFDIKARSDLPEHYDTFELESSSDPIKPTLMYIPDYIERVNWIKYNQIGSEDTDQDYNTLSFLKFPEFLKRMYQLKESESNVGSYDIIKDGDSFTVLYVNDKAPQFYTVYADRNVLFDSYDSTVDNILQKNKTLCYGPKSVNFVLEDAFIPDLDEDQFPLLLNEAKALAWFEMKQQPHVKAEQNARRNWVHLQKNKTRYKGYLDFEQLPNFGKK